jgi:competence/damage-inducible protein CinA-like protein
MQAEIVSIGTELLLGDIVDTNAAHIAQQLKGIGLDLLYKTTVGDNEQRIASVIDYALNRADVVITSGGLGPTIDDVTREAIARATGRPLHLEPILLDQIAERFRRFGVQMSDNNRRQALIPEGAIPIENPVGTAPIFILQTERGVIMTLPGVPREMKYLLEHSLIPWLRDYLGAPSVIESLVLRTAGIGESQIDAKITDLMTMTNPTVGLAAHAGQTDIRVTAKAPTVEEAKRMIEPVAVDLRQRLRHWIYGTGTDRIEETVSTLLHNQSARLAILEIGTGGTLKRRMEELGDTADDSVLTETAEHVGDVLLGMGPFTGLEDAAKALAQSLRARHETTYGLTILIHSDDGITDLPAGTAMAIVGEDVSRTRYFGWSRERTDSDIWATTHALALIRRTLLNVEEPHP